MGRNNLQILALAVCLVGVSCAHDLLAEESARDGKAIEGLWSGSWGGGSSNGVVYQPVRVDLFIQGDHVELCGFGEPDRLTGTVRLDPGAKQMRITPAAEASAARPKTIVYTYEMKDGELTLVNRDKLRASLHRQPVATDPLANVQVNLVAATGINDAGDLLVTEFALLRVGRAGTPCFEPLRRSLKTKSATVLLVEDSGCKKLTLDEARRRIREPTLVAVAYRHDDRSRRHQLHRLWKDTGPPTPDGAAVSQTYARILRPGTLVFVLSARKNVPEP